MYKCFFYSTAQLPETCTTEKYDGTCCPVNQDNKTCNGRGTCVNTSDNDPWMTYCDGRDLSEMLLYPSRNKVYKNKYCKTLIFCVKDLTRIKLTLCTTGLLELLVLHMYANAQEIGLVMTAQDASEDMMAPTVQTK